MARQQFGQPMGMEKSLERRAREAKRRKRQEERWAGKSGPVTVRYVCPLCGGPHSKADHPD